MTKLGADGQVKVQNKDHGRVYSAKITGFDRDKDDLLIQLRELELTDPGEGDKASGVVARASIRLSLVGTSPLEAHRWRQAVAAVWGEVKDQDDGGGTVDVQKWVGRTVKVQRVVTYMTVLEGVRYEGWDFLPQAAFDVKAKVALAGVKGKVARFFSRKKP